jgi:hypothetical protein
LTRLFLRKRNVVPLRAASCRARGAVESSTPLPSPIDVADVATVCASAAALISPMPRCSSP